MLRLYSLFCLYTLICKVQSVVISSSDTSSMHCVNSEQLQALLLNQTSISQDFSSVADTTTTITAIIENKLTTVSTTLENRIHSSDVTPDIHAAQLVLPISAAPLLIAVPTNSDYTSTMIINGKAQEIVVTIKDITDNSHIRSCYRKEVPFSQYWIPKENEWDETNDGERVYLGGGESKKKLMDKNKRELAVVSEEMYNKCEMEGTCLLENGDLINIDNSTDSFIKVGGLGRQHNVFGLGSGSQNLVPFVSVAANDLPYGQTLYIEELDGLDLGYNQVHNGCVRVDDNSWSFDSCQIDFFVLSYVDYLWLDLDEKVSVKFTKCQVKNYVMPHHLALVKATNNHSIIPSILEAKYYGQD